MYAIVTNDTTHHRTCTITGDLIVTGKIRCGEFTRLVELENLVISLTTQLAELKDLVASTPPGVFFEEGGENYLKAKNSFTSKNYIVKE